LVTEDAAQNPVPMALTYASGRDLEIALFRFLGYFGLVQAALTILKVFDGVPFDQITPQWITSVYFLVYFPQDAGLMRNATGFWNSLQPPIGALLSVFLFAGSLGCIRRYSKTRRWLILFGVLSLLNALVLLTAWVAQRPSTSNLNLSTLWEVYNLAGRALIENTLAVVLLWLMTRPNVDQLFRPQ
jgi:hypothetical protein